MKIKKFLLALVAVVFAPVTFLTGCGHTHDYGTDYQTDATNHWLECSCGEKKDVEEHSAKETYSKDETNHWKDCEDCGYDLSVEAHNYNQEVATETYLVDETDTKITYNKSCVCGQAGTETFDVTKEVATLSLSMSSVQIVYGDNYSVNVTTNNTAGTQKIEYKLASAEDTTYSATMPRDAGEYVARVTVEGNKEYTTVTGTIGFEIEAYVLTGLTTQVYYNGTEYQFVELDDIEYGLRLDISFQSKNVGANPTAVIVTLGGEPTNNYEVDTANCTVEVVKKPINIVWQTNTEPLYFEGSAIVPTYEFDSKCEGDNLSANLSVHEGNNNTYDSTFKMAATLTGTDADNYELQNEYSGVYTIVDLDAVTVGGSFDFSEGGTKVLLKTNLTANKYYRFFNEGGNSYAQGVLTTISVYKKSNNALVATRVFDSTGTGDVFDHTYFTVDATGEYYLVATLNTEDEYVMFHFEEDEHSELDDYGFCTVCGEYKGQTYESEQVISQTVTGGQKCFFRIAVAEGTDIEYGIITDGSLSASALKVYYVSNADPRTMSVANVSDLILVEDDNLNPGELNDTQTNALINSIDGYFYFVLEGPINTQFKIRVVDFSS